ncbi:capsule assembly Wzi family protein [Sphingobacterium sp. MYb382]|uniref:capsule assembly Wzi family protein n=1 Tax=Sphingobacterium sp. MYb382 TaxID=2745278 RepID=UPI0030B6DB04
MKSHRPKLLTYCLCLFYSASYAQTTDSIPKKGLYIELQGGFTSNNVVPFWMRSNQYGSIPVEGGSGSAIIRSFRDYRQKGEWQGNNNNNNNNNNNSLWDFGYAFEGRVNLGKETQAQLIDAHLKMKFAMFEIKAGRSKDVMGLNGDTLLTSGNFAVSGTALGVPKFEISIPEYYRLKMFGGLFSFKGNFANGYTGMVEMAEESFLKKPKETSLPNYLHQKSLYGRLGKASWPIELYAGFNHQAQWGSEKKLYGSAFKLSFLETLWYVNSGKAYGGPGTPIPRSKIGNHQGSIDLGASYNFGPINIMVYRQNFYDVGALYHLANIKDGLNGITITNNNYKKKNNFWDWHKVLVEFFYSKDQAGYPWSRSTKSGDENYYNHYEFREGWSYKGIVVGSPLIIAANTARSGQVSNFKEYFISNRVAAGHIGFSGHVDRWEFLSKVTLSRHYGTFRTSEWGGSLGPKRFPPLEIPFTPVNQFSFLLQSERLLSERLYVGGTIALDQGKMLPNTFGIMGKIRKAF